MRSSIACDRCRRSKVKCSNAGVHSTCEACRNTRRICTYSDGSSAGARRESVHASPHAASQRVNGQGEPVRKKRKTIAPASHLTAPFPADKAASDKNPLDPQVLTPKVWKELSDIYRCHFASDLPFIHGSTFRKLIQQSPHDDASPQRGYSSLFLLAFLALTSRFHEELVAYYCPPSESRARDRLWVAEFYAAKAYEQLAPPHQAQHQDSHTMLERAQAQLMLCLHQWGMLQGSTARLSLSAATTTAEMAGLNVDQFRTTRTRALNPNLEFNQIDNEIRAQTPPSTNVENPVVQEILRRTFWSCFILDRYLAGGFGRSKQIPIDRIRVELPMSDEAFAFGRKVKTHRLQPWPTLIADGRRPVNGAYLDLSPRQTITAPQESSEPVESGETEGALSCYIRALDLYGDITQWSCDGGRRKEEHPPWNPKSAFYKHQRALEEFSRRLPRNLRLREANTAAHSESKTPTHYFLLHVILLLCSIMLHREYVPFLPFICDKPTGPLDEPHIVERPDEEEYWENSARKCFKPARELIDLICTYRDWGTLVETPLSAFAVFQVCTVGMYCQHFPQMDPDRDMVTSDRMSNIHPCTPYSILREMCVRLKMARDWCIYIKKLNKFFQSRTKDYKNFKRQLGSQSTSGSTPGSADSGTYLNGQGGLTFYMTFERYLKDFGIPYDEDREHVEGDIEIPDGDWDTARSEAGSGPIRAESTDRGEDTRTSTAPSGGFTSVNSNTSRPAAEALTRPTNSHIHHHPPLPNELPPDSTSPRDGYRYGSVHANHATPYPPVSQYMNHVPISATRDSLSLHAGPSPDTGAYPMVHQPGTHPSLQVQYPGFFPQQWVPEIATFTEGTVSRDYYENLGHLPAEAYWLGYSNDKPVNG